MSLQITDPNVPQLTLVIEWLREQIRARVPEFTNVFPTRSVPLHEALLPCAEIYCSREDGEVFDDGSPRVHQWQAQLTIAVNVALPFDEHHVDDQGDKALRRFMHRVRQVVLADDTLGSTVQNVLPGTCEYTPSREGEVFFSAGHLTLTVLYSESAPAPEELVLSNLRWIGGKWDAAPAPDGEIDAEDLVDLQEP
jgi:hypothetical protein